MLEIHLEDVDTQSAFSLEFGVLTYLQGLVDEDANSHVLNHPELAFARECAATYLWDRQRETAVRFRQMVQSEDFTHKTRVPDDE